MKKDLKMNDIKVGGKSYSINFCDTIEDETFNENENAYGYIDYAYAKIVIRDDISSSFKQENLIHEILHSLLENTGVSEKNIESTIEVLAPRIHAFLIDNPEFQDQFLNLKKVNI